jgi:type I restriction enzyme, S subunit
MKSDWQQTTLGAACEMYQPETISTKQLVPDGPFPVYGANGVIGRYDKFNHAESQLLVTCRGATCGSVNISTPNAWITGNAMVVRPRDPQKLSLRFLEYLFRGGIDLASAITGAAQPQITRTNLSPLAFAFPKLRDEQHRIVGILDKAFEAIATAKANTKKNLQNARAIFESRLDAIFADPRTGWVTTAIGDVIQFIDYRGKTPKKTTCGVRLITAKNVKMGYLQDEPMEFIASSDYKGWMTRGIPENGDVLFTTEAPLANVAQLNTDERVAFAQRIIIMQPDKRRMDKTFLKYSLLSSPAQKRIREKGTGATVQGIKASLLRKIEISFPQSLGEQRNIVVELDKLRIETQRLESMYHRKLAALDELKKSLLHQAFSGQL